MTECCLTVSDCTVFSPAPQCCGIACSSCRLLINSGAADIIWTSSVRHHPDRASPCPMHLRLRVLLLLLPLVILTPLTVPCVTLQAKQLSDGDNLRLTLCLLAALTNHPPPSRLHNARQVSCRRMGACVGTVPYDAVSGYVWCSPNQCTTHASAQGGAHPGYLTCG